MEPPAPPRRRVYLLVLVTTLAAAAAAGVGLHLYRGGPVIVAETPLNRMVRNDLPMLDVVLKFRGLDGADLNANATRFGDDSPLPPATEQCPALVGGDSSAATTLSPDDQRPADCPRRAAWHVKRHPIAYSLYVEDGKALLDWYDHQPQVREWAGNRFVQGLLFGFLHSLKVKAEDLNLQGLQGEFMALLLRDAITAQAQLHYDAVHGRQGWVLSFVRRDSPYAAQALPVLAGLLARNGFRAERLPEPILEMRVGLQRFFLTQYEDRLYLANGMEALFNVLESLTPPSQTLAAPLRLTVRAEAFLERLPQVLAGTPAWDVNLGFSLQDGKPGVLSLPSGTWERHLHARIYEGVLAGIPHDAFAAVATSFELPPTRSLEEWRKLATDGPGAQAVGVPEPGGFALVWDFDAREAASGAIGLAIANQTDPQATAGYQQYLRNADLSAECGGGAVFLAASSERLLARMKEACAHQSLSPLDWEHGKDKQRYTAAQLMAFVNPGAGLRELFLAGGAGAEGDEDGDFRPRWKQEYEAAKAAMRKDGDRLFRALPILAWAGRSGGEKAITLEGVAVSQGVVSPSADPR